MKKIKISKKEWENKRIAQAPVKAPPSPVKTTPPPGKPTETPRGPFNPPRPHVTPNPKGKQKGKDVEKNVLSSTLRSFEQIIRSAQNYQRESHPAVRNFWSNIPQEHPFAQHPVLSKHGPKLSEEGFEFTRGKLSEGGNIPPTKGMEMLAEVQKILPQILRLEATHEDELIEMAKDITAEIWGCDKSMLVGGITKEPGAMDEGEHGQEGGQEERALVDVTPALQDQINKRITSNILTQGASVHAMASVHHLVAEKIGQISPELLDLYTRMSALATHQYYALDIPAIIKMMANIADAGIGWSRVEFPKETQQPQGIPNAEQQQDQPKVIAQGICFPVLCQEMFKGVMELISMHGISQELTPDELYTVYHYADRLEDEPWQITVGPALWRKLIALLPQGIGLAEVVQKLSMKNPQEMNDLINDIVENPDQAKEIFSQFKEPEVKEQYLNEDEKPAGELVVPEETFDGLEDIFEKPKKDKKDKGAGGLVVPEDTFKGLEDVFNERSIPNKKKS